MPNCFLNVSEDSLADRFVHLGRKDLERFHQAWLWNNRNKNYREADKNIVAPGGSSKWRPRRILPVIILMQRSENQQVWTTDWFFSSHSPSFFNKWWTETLWDLLLRGCLSFRKHCCTVCGRQAGVWGGGGPSACFSFLPVCFLSRVSTLIKLFTLSRR